jgi:hypothetical protein
VSCYAKPLSKCGMDDKCQGMRNKRYPRSCNSTPRGSRRVGLGDSKLTRLSVNGVWIFRVLDEVDLVASPGYETTAGWGDGEFECVTVDEGSEQL